MAEERKAGSDAESDAVPKAPAKKSSRKAGARSKAKRRSRKAGNTGPGLAKYPRHSVRKALRIPKAILDQNAGRATTDREALQFAGLSYTGPSRVELSSSSKYGFLERVDEGQVKPTDLAKRVLRPQSPGDEVEGLREAVLRAPDVSAVYTHYRGENLPDEPFLTNALVDTFKIPPEKVGEFRAILLETLEEAGLLEDHGGKKRVRDIAAGPAYAEAGAASLRRLEKAAKPTSSDTCFVMMPFADPIGGYYATIYEPAVVKAGLRSVRADDDIFATGKIMDQVWIGINAAKVLVAELTTRNPNVFYELGLAHALQKPVVLVSRNEEDVPFDLHHIRVIYYDVNDPFWGEKLINKIAENVLSALSNPGEAVFRAAVQ